jgi:hypothetical protein
MKARKCECCGAPLKGSRCEYCGVEYIDENEDTKIKPPHPCEVNDFADVIIKAFNEL